MSRCRLERLKAVEQVGMEGARTDGNNRWNFGCKNNGRKSADQGENFGRSTKNSDKYSPLEGSTS